MENDGSDQEQIHLAANHRGYSAGEAGLPIKELCCKGGFNDQTILQTAHEAQRMEVPNGKLLRDLQRNNARPKKLLTETLLDILSAGQQKIAISEQHS